MKINAEEETKIADDYSVEGYPTVLLIKNGKVQGEPILGAYPKEHYVERLNALLQ